MDNFSAFAKVNGIRTAAEDWGALAKGFPGYGTGGTRTAGPNVGLGSNVGSQLGTHVVGSNAHQQQHIFGGWNGKTVGNANANASSSDFNAGVNNELGREHSYEERAPSERDTFPSQWTNSDALRGAKNQNPYLNGPGLKQPNLHTHNAWKG